MGAEAGNRPWCDEAEYADGELETRYRQFEWPHRNGNGWELGLDARCGTGN